MNPDLSSDQPQEHDSFQEKIPKITLPPKPTLVSALAPNDQTTALPDEEMTPPAIPSTPLQASAKNSHSSFFISLPLLFAAIIAALVAFGVQLWALL